jgi:hypothetical protein
MGLKVKKQQLQMHLPVGPYGNIPRKKQVSSRGEKLLAAEALEVLLFWLSPEGYM